MARLTECPKCGRDISESYEPAEPDVGIMMGGWYCEHCDFVVVDESYPDDLEM